MNSIVTQLTVNKEYPADIVFEDTSDFSEISQRLMKHPIFECCYQFAFLEAKAQYSELPLEERHKIDRHPSKLFPIPHFSHKYSDFCANLDSYATKFFYYGLLEQGMSPTVHFVS